MAYFLLVHHIEKFVHEINNELRRWQLILAMPDQEFKSNI